MRASPACFAPVVMFLLACSSSAPDGAPSTAGGSAGAVSTAGNTVGGGGSAAGGGGSAAGGGGSAAGGGGSAAGGMGGSAGKASGGSNSGAAGQTGLGAGVPCSQPFETEGSDLSGCIAEVAGVTMKFFPLAAQVPVERVAVYLHGDGAVDWEGWYPFLAETVEWCKARNILVVAPLSPVAYDEDPPEMRSFGAAFDDQAEQVGGALEQFLDAYAAPHTGLLYWSMSGGSWFATSSFLPLFGERLPGAYALSCGASEFWFDYAWDIAGSARSQNQLLFNYGTEDFLKPGELASAQKFEGDGFRVSVKTHPSAQHCAHPVHAPTVEFWLGAL
jgi:hypothetical protein